MTNPTLRDIHAEQIRAALAEIAAANNGLLNPAKVVEAARDPNSVLHGEFQWDNDEAADSYRLAQAGALIRRVKFTLIRENHETKTVEVRTTRAFQSRESMRGEGGYEAIDEIMSDAEKREELMDQVLRELVAYRKRYADILTLSNVWVAIDDAVHAFGVSAPSWKGKAGQARQGAA